ncbi:hypothetical protein ACEWY4_015987 [Coilia grayii]|uniref:Uncharacterized protein n=1 Tax=Coilia grayii TaxID=363190 RepID=A0ABD1JQJ9_9TELE
MSKVPLLSYIYFTPSAPGAKTHMVMNMTQSLDPHYTYKDETVFIAELTERDEGILSWSRQESKKSTEFLQLVMKDCTIDEAVQYGERLEIFLPGRAEVLEFSPSLRPSEPQEVWRQGTAGSTGRLWAVDAVTSAHEGNYTARNLRGLELQKTRVTVIATSLSTMVDLTIPTDVMFPIPLPKFQATITFTDASGRKHILYREGIESLSLFSIFDDRVSLQIQPSGSRVLVRDVRPGDAGTYEVRDLSGHLVVRAELVTTGSPQPFQYVFIALVVVAVVLLVLCCCVCKCCCCRKASSKAPHTPSPGTATASYSGSGAESWYRPPLPRGPLMDALTQHPQPADAEGTSLYPFPSNASPQVDEGPSFQPKRRPGDSLDFLSILPLSTDTLHASVYTSHKLDFP